MKFIITEEQNEKLIQKVKSVVEKYGVEHTIKLFNGVDIIKRVYQDNPSEFLEQFNDLKPVKKGDTIFYVDKDGLPLFYYNPNKKNVYIDYYRIWIFFDEVIDIAHWDIQDIMIKWLEETYNLKELRPNYFKEYYGSLL